MFQFDCHLDTLWNIQEESFFEQILVRLAYSDACAVLFPLVDVGRLPTECDSILCISVLDCLSRHAFILFLLLTCCSTFLLPSLPHNDKLTVFYMNLLSPELILSWYLVTTIGRESETPSFLSVFGVYLE